MSWGKRGGGPRGYHHGNLKEALVRAALALIAEKGPAGFTFADAARWAGVSPAAPYRHYRDRDAQVGIAVGRDAGLEHRRVVSRLAARKSEISLAEPVESGKGVGAPVVPTLCERHFK